MLYMVNSPKGRKKTRSPAQRAATRKMLAARKKKLKAKRARSASKKSSRTTITRSRNMAARKKSHKPRRKRTTHKRKLGVRLVRRGQTVYQGNPRRRHHRNPRRRHYSRNPGFGTGIVRQITGQAMDATMTLVGGAAARTVNGFIPIADTGLTGTAKGLLSAYVVGWAGRRFLGGDRGRFIAAGAMQVPIKALITSLVPQAGAFLGDYDGVGAYALPAPHGVGDYLQSGSMAAYEMGEGYVDVSGI
jgi:hypothetical protein